MSLRDFFYLTPVKPSQFTALKGDMEGITIAHLNEGTYPEFYNEARALFIQAENAENLFFQKDFDKFFQIWEEKAKSLVLRVLKA